MRMLTALLAIAAVASATGLALASATATHEQSPASFLGGVIRDLAANRYRHAWETLRPADQELVPRDVYVACESRTPIPGHLVSLRIRGVERDGVGVAVTFALRIAGAAVPTGVDITLTAHAVPTTRGWAWMLPPARRVLYRTGCGVPRGPAA